MPAEEVAAVDLHWIPLGAGGWFVRLNGRLFEAIVARRQHRARCDLFHAALLIRRGEEIFGIEQTPAWGQRQHDRQVVATGPVGARWAGRFVLFRYEVHIAPGGGIPDIAESVGGPRRLSGDARVAAAVLAAVQEVPVLTWGRDEAGAGEMWNSNSVIAWTLSRAGVDAGAIRPPDGGRAPGWAAGLKLARGHV